MSNASQRLRAAADRLRTLAKAASPGPWTVMAVVYGPPQDGWGQPSDFEITDPGRRTVVSHMRHEGGGIHHKPDADLIATMHPGVALGLADWLEREARTEDYHLAEFGYRTACDEAVALANLIVNDAPIDAT